MRKQAQAEVNIYLQFARGCGQTGGSYELAGDGMSHAMGHNLKVRVLGSGTSMGVPVIGCRCAVCTSDDPYNKRLRTSVALDVEGTHLLIDCGIDFREQMLRWPMPRLDAVLLTHTHSDHINGIDELRVYNYLQRGSIPLHTSQYFIDDLRQRFQYCFNPLQQGGGIPQLDLMPVTPGQPFQAAGVEVIPIGIMHGVLPILGYRIGNFAYLTDCSAIPEESLPLLQGLEVLILTALRRTPHPTHFNLEQALEAAAGLGAKRVFFIHMNDELDHHATNRTLPDWARLAHDGLLIEVNGS
jgi:phosphoribosyl 1,2-cyclic phosphate phosphodiesterase